MTLERLQEDIAILERPAGSIRSVRALVPVPTQSVHQAHIPVCAPLTLVRTYNSVYGGLSCIRQSWRSHYRVTKRNFVHVGLGVHSHAFTPSIQPTRNSLTTTQNGRPDRWCLRLHRRDHICLVTDFHPRPACTDLQIGCLTFREILLLLQITVSLRNWQLGCAGPWGQDPWLMQRP